MKSSALTESGFTLRNGTGEKIALTMQDLYLGGNLSPIGATLVVRHIFKSIEDDPVEAIYSFMLPRDATLKSFKVVAADKTVESDLKPRKEAEADYEEAIQKGHLSVMTQIYSDGIVNLNVGNIKPGETVVVYLEIVAGVELNDSSFRFRFPFTMAPSYHKDAKYFESDFGTGEIELPEEQFGGVILPVWKEDPKNLFRIGFNLNVDIKDTLRTISSPSHPIKHIQKDDNSSIVTLATADDIPNRDLVLDVSLNSKSPVIFNGKDTNGTDRMAILIPSSAFGEFTDKPKRILFLIDRSGSMGGAPMQQALKSVEACIALLSEKDMFGIIAFDTVNEVFTAEMIPATSENRIKAQAFLSNIHARGATELASGLQKSAEVLGKSTGDILLFTDGQVFSGEEIIEYLKTLLLRVHCLGIGSASQDRFLTLISRESGGVSRFVTPRERVDLAAIELFNSINSPIATDLTFEYEEDSSDVSIYPPPPPTVFCGSPVVFFISKTGRKKSKLPKGFSLRWKSGPNEKKILLPFENVMSVSGDTIKSIQGARILTDLDVKMDNYKEGGTQSKRERTRLEKLMEKTSLEYGLSSRVMSLVAVIKRKGDRAGELPKVEIVPVGMPDNTSFDAYFLNTPRMLAAPQINKRLAKIPTPGYLSAENELNDIDVCEKRKLSLRRPALRRMCSNSSISPSLPDEDRVDVNGILVELASSILGDGGLPGKNESERILKSLLALLAFYENGNSASHGIFSAHFKRIAQYLTAALPNETNKKHRDMVSKVLDLIDHGKRIPGEWSEIASQCLEEKEYESENGWKIIKLLTEDHLSSL